MKQTAAQKRGRGQPPHVPTKATRETVRRYIAAGISEPVIAKRIGICQNTLRFHYLDDLEFGRDMKRADIIDWAEASAKKGSVPAMKLLRELHDKAALVQRQREFDPAGHGEPKPDVSVSRAAPKAAKLGKKEEAVLRAHEAVRDSSWGDDLKHMAKMPTVQ
jgi:hypothetical protein